MSLLNIGQDVADVIGLTRPSAIVTGTDQLSRQILGMAKEVLEELAGMNWPVLEVAYSFQTVVGQSQYALPSDFQREIGDTMYLATQYYSIRGSLTPGDWARTRNSLPSQLGRYKMRIFGSPSALNITPTPQTIETVTYEYITLNHVIRADGSHGATYSADTDVAMVGDELVRKGVKWRLKRAKGLDYSEEFNDYEVSRARRYAHALALGSIAVAYRPMLDSPEIAIGYVPESGFGA